MTRTDTTARTIALRNTGGSMTFDTQHAADFRMGCCEFEPTQAGIIRDFADPARGQAFAAGWALAKDAHVAIELAELAWLTQRTTASKAERKALRATIAAAELRFDWITAEPKTLADFDIDKGA